MPIEPELLLIRFIAARLWAEELPFWKIIVNVPLMVAQIRPISKLLAAHATFEGSLGSTLFLLLLPRTGGLRQSLGILK